MKYVKILLIASVLIGATACDNDTDIELFDSPLQQAGPGTIKVNNASVSMLTFAWEPVSGVYQYGYKLINPLDQVVRQGVTSETRVTFERLEAATTYRFEIEAYGANQVPTQLFTAEGSTPAYVQLATPDESAFTLSKEGGVVQVSWPAIDHAQYYEYILTSGGGANVIATGTVDEPKVNLGSLAEDSYTIEVQAMTDEEGYLMSNIAAYDFVVGRALVRSYEGTYYSYMDEMEFACTLNIYDDGTWVLKSFYGVEGYDLEMYVDEEEGPVTILNAFSEWGSYKYVYTGLDGDNYYVVMYEDPSYCCYYEDEDGQQVLMFYLFLGEDAEGGTDYFVWNEAE